jgi:hypothetical protein
MRKLIRKFIFWLKLKFKKNMAYNLKDHSDLTTYLRDEVFTKEKGINAVVELGYAGGEKLCYTLSLSVGGNVSIYFQHLYNEIELGMLNCDNIPALSIDSLLTLFSAIRSAYTGTIKNKSKVNGYITSLIP